MSRHRQGMTFGGDIPAMAAGAHAPSTPMAHGSDMPVMVAPMEALGEDATGWRVPPAVLTPRVWASA
jgi:hypothetical protein